MTKREMLLKKISTAQFAALDTQLFLDTHPGDEESVEKMKKYRDMAKPLIKEYEQKYPYYSKLHHFIYCFRSFSSLEHFFILADLY